MSDAKYSFFSWVRQGLAKYVEVPTGSTVRGKVQVTLKSNAGADVVELLEIAGPGDIIGLDPRNIVQVHPEPNTGNFESNYLPFIEFYQDTFLWDYTPKQANGNRLEPWLFLLVLEESEYTRTENPQGLDFIDVSNNSVFPPHDDIWAWGHVHVNAETADLPALKTQLDINPDFAVCRLLSPRRLQPNKRYEAFVIPAFETGRKTGLGIEINPTEPGFDALQASWGEQDQNIHPVYYSWSFQTGEKGDFESLARELKPYKDLDDSIGFRPLNIEEAGVPYNNILPNPDQQLVTEVALGGALKPVGSGTSSFLDKTWQVQLCTLLNRRDGQQEQGGLTGDPVIVPPTYGHWHALVSKLNKGSDDVTLPINDGDSQWLHTLNIEPAHRAAAGVGTKVVQENQDHYLSIAWEQIGAVLEANQLIKQAQLGIEIAVRWWDKHITSQSNAEIVSMGGPILSSVWCPGISPRNVFSHLQQSGTPAAVFSPAFRKLSNKRGRIVKKFKKRKSRPYEFGSITEGLTSLNNGLATAPNKPNIADGKPQAIEVQMDTPNGVITSAINPCQFPGFVSSDGNVQKGIFLPPKQLELLMQGSNPNINWDIFFQNGIPVNSNELIQSWGALSATFYCDPTPVYPPPVSLSEIMPCIKTILYPGKTIKDRVITKIGTEADLDAIIPIMAAPDYPEPMYKKLLAQSEDFILPNLNKLPNNSISLMETNQAFIEAFMVGLNYEMARELIWNEYPTDQRGSYFRQFWDVSKYIDTEGLQPAVLSEKLKDIDFIHRWLKWTDMGEHRKGPTTTTPLVLTIRGDLLQRYPETMIFAVKANGDESFNSGGNKKYPIFSAKVEPDITFLGFELSETEVRGDGNDGGWFFCIKEPPAGPRFGLDLKPEGGILSYPSPTEWNNLHWGHINDDYNIKIDPVINLYPNPDPENLTWGSESSHMASILYQVPVLVAIHATQLLPD